MFGFRWETGNRRRGKEWKKWTFYTGLYYIIYTRMEGWMGVVVAERRG